MPSLKWLEDSRSGLVDHHGKIGPLDTFSISQLVEDGRPVQKYRLISRWIPCKNRRQEFKDVEAAKREAHRILEVFKGWIAGCS